MSEGRVALSVLPEALRLKLQAQLDMLPEQYRHKIEAQLARLPTDQLRELVQRGSPMLDKLVARANAAASPPQASAPKAGAPARPGKPAGHYNQTVQPGDKPTWFGIVLLIAASGLAVLLVQRLF